MNNYHLAGRNLTTGWDASLDANERNDLGMTPAQVAAQAGNVEEFAAITMAPDFDPSKMGKLQVYIEICRRESYEAYAKFQHHFKTEFCKVFHFDDELGVWTRRN